MAKEHRREHPHAAVVGGSIVVASPRAAIEAHASMGKAAKKNLQAFSPVHPSMVGQTNRGHAVLKSQTPAAPINPAPNVGRPTPAPEVHDFAAGRGISGRDTPGQGGIVAHDPRMGDRVLDEVFDAGAVNNKLPGERHHSVTGPKGAYAGPGAPAVGGLPSKPADSTTTPQTLIDQFERWNRGEC